MGLSLVLCSYLIVGSLHTGPLSYNLSFICTLLNEIDASQDLNSDVFPPPTNHKLRRLSTSETMLIPIVGAVLANVIETSRKVDKLTAAVEALNSPAPQNVEAITSLQASVHDLSQRVTASTRACPPHPAAQPALSICPPAVSVRYGPHF